MLSDRWNWTPEQIEKMTLAQIVIYLGESEAGRQLSSSEINKVIAGMQAEHGGA